MVFIKIQVLGQLFFQNWVLVLSCFHLILPLTSIKTVASEKSCDLFCNSLFILFISESFLESCDVEFNQKLIKLFIQFLVQNNLGAKLERRVTIFYLINTFKVLTNRFIRKQKLSVIITHPFHFPLQ